MDQSVNKAAFQDFAISEQKRLKKPLEVDKQSVNDGLAARVGRAVAARKRGRPVSANHNRKSCKVCALPNTYRWRVEQDFKSWASTRQIADNLTLLGYKIGHESVWSHCVALGFDIERASDLERGVMRLVNHGFNLLDEGRIQLRGNDLVAALKLLAQLKGLLTENQAINNILIRNNLSSLEDIAKIKDPEVLRQRTSELFRELQTMGAFTTPGQPQKTTEEREYDETARIVRNRIAKLDAAEPTDGQPVHPDNGAGGFSGDRPDGT